MSARTIHDVQQGTGPWLRLREGRLTASEAPAALGVSRYVTRAELLRRKHTGVAEEHSAATLGKFAAGHAAEAAARPLAEELLSTDLFPVTVTLDVDGLPLLASLDGLTLDEETAWESKLWNEELAAAVRSNALPEHYLVQMDQALLVTGAKRCLFTCTDGTRERFVWCFHERDEARFDALLAGWRQFLADLEGYTLQPKAEPAVAEPMEALPAVAVRMDGRLVVQSNLPAFGAALRAFVDRVPKAPSTDNEFATTEAACKALKRAEDALDAAEANALASMADVEVMRRMVADFRNLARDTRLAAEKMVDRRKRDLKDAEVVKAREALALHVDLLNAEIAPATLRPLAADFGGAIKGLKTLDSVRAKLDATLAAAKIEADAQAKGIRANLAAFKAQAAGFEFLFADLAQIVHKAADDFGAVVAARIAQHKVAEAEKAERERVRLEAEARAKVEAETRAAAEKRMAIAYEQAKRRAGDDEPYRVYLSFSGDHGHKVPIDRVDAYIEALNALQAPPTVPPAAPAVAPVAAPVTQIAPIVPPQAQIVPPAPRADEPATLKLGEVCTRLGFVVTAAFVTDTLGVKPAKVDGAARLYTESQFACICVALCSHIGQVHERLGERAAA
jgi:predicted phage-related endonuclease